MNFDYKSLEEGIDVDSRSLEEYRLNATEPVPLLYQTGYLTIKDYKGISAPTLVVIAAAARAPKGVSG